MSFGISLTSSNGYTSPIGEGFSTLALSHVNGSWNNVIARRSFSFTSNHNPVIFVGEGGMLEYVRKSGTRYTVGGSWSVAYVFDSNPANISKNRAQYGLEVYNKDSQLIYHSDMKAARVIGLVQGALNKPKITWLGNHKGRRLAYISNGGYGMGYFMHNINLIEYFVYKAVFDRSFPNMLTAGIIDANDTPGSGLMDVFDGLGVKDASPTHQGVLDSMVVNMTIIDVTDL